MAKTKIRKTNTGIAVNFDSIVLVQNDHVVLLQK